MNGIPTEQPSFCRDSRPSLAFLRRPTDLCPSSTRWSLLAWDEIQKDCFQVFGSAAKLGGNRTVRDIADGKGFVSRIGVVENPWEDTVAAEQNGCPSKFVVKMATALQQEKYTKQLEADVGTDKKFFDDEAIAEQAAIIIKLHNVECQMYQKLKDVDEERPNSGYLIMEFVENAADIGNDTCLPEEVVLEILKAIAKYHSCGQLFTEEEKTPLTIGIVKDLFGTMLAPMFIDTCLDITSKVLGEEGTVAVEQLRKGTAIISTEELKDKLDNVAEVTGMERVLVHGDPWTCNVICAKEDDKVHLRALIDYQTSHFGCVGHDLARLFTNVLSYNDRKEKITDYIQKYFEYLVSFWPQDRELPFTKEQVMKSYQAYLPLTTYVVAVSVAALLETRVKQSRNPEETRAFLKKKIIDLARTMDESLLYLQEI